MTTNFANHLRRAGCSVSHFSASQRALSLRKTRLTKPSTCIDLRGLAHAPSTSFLTKCEVDSRCTSAVLSSTKTRCVLEVVVATALLWHRIVEDFTHDKGLKLGLVSEQIGLVFSGVIAKLRSFLGNAAKAVREALRPRPCSVVAGLAADLLRSRSELMAENALLRQQLIVAARKAKNPVFQRHERTLITLLAAVLPSWRDVLLLVKP